MVCASGTDHRKRAHGQWQRVSLGRLPGRRGPREATTDPQPSLSSADQRQGGALHPNPAPGMGLCDLVRAFVATDPGAEALASALQHDSPAFGTRVSTAVLTLSASRAMNNLARNHT